MIHPSNSCVSIKLPSIPRSKSKAKGQILLLRQQPSPNHKERYPPLDKAKYRNQRINLMRDSMDSNKTPKTNESSSFLFQNSMSSGATSKRWKKVSNIIRTISYLKSHDIKEIKNDNEFETDLKDYKERLFPNSCVNAKKTKRISKETFTKKMKKIFVEAITDDVINNNEHNREVLKEEMWFNIQNNSENVYQVIDELFMYNPDRNIRKVEDPEFIFNTPLQSNKKTLLYLACKEGKEEIVSYLLDKKINPKIDSNVDGVEESPLQCACRWNYIKVVDVLLSKVDYTRSEVIAALKVHGLSKNVISSLKRYLMKNANEDKVSCFC